METVYAMVPAGSRSYYFMIPVLVLLAVVLVVAGVMGVATLRGSQHSTFRVSDDALVLRGDVYGRRLPLEQLELDRARVVNLPSAPELQPVSRRMGTALPGYAAGWFRLKNREKALLYLTDRSRVLYVPTRSGYSLLLSPEHPAEMLADLRRRAAR